MPSMEVLLAMNESSTGGGGGLRAAGGGGSMGGSGGHHGRRMGLTDQMESNQARRRTTVSVNVGGDDEKSGPASPVQQGSPISPISPNFSMSPIPPLAGGSSSNVGRLATKGSGSLGIKEVSFAAVGSGQSASSKGGDSLDELMLSSSLGNGSGKVGHGSAGVSIPPGSTWRSPSRTQSELLPSPDGTGGARSPSPWLAQSPVLPVLGGGRVSSFVSSQGRGVARTSVHERGSTGQKDGSSALRRRATTDFMTSIPDPTAGYSGSMASPSDASGSSIASAPSNAVAGTPGMGRYSRLEGSLDMMR